MQVVENAKKATSAQVSKLSDFSLSKLMPGGVPVVEVRENELMDLPSGKERALAFEREKREQEWLLAGPINFKEPTLPEGEMIMTDSLLPSKPE